jgi:leader peptidase (prepilin peptidase) / N-methyltransferase
MTPLVVVAAVVGALLGPPLATATVRLATRDPAARPTARRVGGTSLLTAAALAAAPALAGDRPATLALAWFGGAAVVLAGVDLAVHRLPDRVTWPAAAVCSAALLVDAAVLGTWGAFVRALVAAAVTLAIATAARLVQPAGLGQGDVKLLALLGLVLGWAGWGVLMAGVFAGLLVGAVGSLLLMTVGRAGWRTSVAFGPPLLVGAYVGLALAGPLPGT